MSKAVLFDLDGTILDTAVDLGGALNHVLRHFGFPEKTETEYRNQASNGALGLLTLGFGDKLENYDMAELRAMFLAYYEHNIAVKTTFYEGFEQLLVSLNDMNIPWGIVTNKPEYLTLKLLPHYKLFESCGVVVGGDTLPQRKPDPAPLIFAADKLNVAPSDCLYVGDAPRDIEAGNACNMKTIIAEWGYIDDLDCTKNWQADFSTKTPQEILQFIKQSTVHIINR